MGEVGGRWVEIKYQGDVRTWEKSLTRPQTAARASGVRARARTGQDVTWGSFCWDGGLAGEAGGDVVAGQIHWRLGLAEGYPTGPGCVSHVVDIVVFIMHVCVSV